MGKNIPAMSKLAQPMSLDQTILSTDVSITLIRAAQVGVMSYFQVKRLPSWQ
jgi:hypothetical protein